MSYDRALAVFFAARLDEDEAAANTGARRVGMPWRAEPQPGTPGGLVIDELGLVGSTGGRYAAEHIARHDPARTLREVAAGRHILDLFMSTAALVEHPPVMGEGHPYAGKISVQDYFDARRELAVLRPVVVALAAIYSDHPDYRQEWKP